MRGWRCVRRCCAWPCAPAASTDTRQAGAESVSARGVAEGIALRTNSDIEHVDPHAHGGDGPSLSVDASEQISSAPSSSNAPTAGDHPLEGASIRTLLLRAAWVTCGGAGTLTAGLATAAIVPGMAGLVAAAVGAVGFGAGVWWAWGRAKAPLRELVGIGEALESYSGGELGEDALRIRGEGRLGEGWNRLVFAREAERDA